MKDLINSKEPRKFDLTMSYQNNSIERIRSIDFNLYTLMAITNVLTAAMLSYTIGAGITAAAGT